MNIDPRVMKELLQLQLLNKMSLISGGADASSDDGGLDFQALLETMMEQGQTGAAETGSDSDPLAALAALGGGGSSDLSGLLSGLSAGTSSGNSYIPASLYALNKSYNPLSALGSASATLDTSNASAQYDGLIQSAASRFGVDPALVKAVIHQESDFDHTAVSSAGAKGLMQLMDGTGSGFGVTNPFDPQQNVTAGTHFLANLLSKYNGNEGVALAAYNAGPGRVDRLNIKTDSDLADKLFMLPKETQAYVKKVLGLKAGYAAT
ncbi:lytic transglycosylase domain-containing protein [Paenibacillus athensensis]|uniref:Transglycosylase SLT domain-containing protein n=1 Tax=Paenibacillus athensensis TaxID=1967502 RepID=A0A4Y8PVG5_9BACL|nr:lytic transglycosylase domain-containing protein [Paenibacillus athensensis]MCD1261549.1 lytic transglycosylase domain-containing protein [Paenibacillus athensensis]